VSVKQTALSDQPTPDPAFIGGAAPGAGGRSHRLWETTSGLTVGNLGWREIVLDAPVFVGDTLYAETEITGKRLSNSRPHNGIVTCRTCAFNAAGQRVLHYTRSFLVPADPAAIRDQTGY
jgi:itaconyl-CoA hydratase